VVTRPVNRNLEEFPGNQEASWEPVDLCNQKSRSLAPQTHPERKKRASLGMTPEEEDDN
jgi:hypothetical protein